MLLIGERGAKFGPHAKSATNVTSYSEFEGCRKADLGERRHQRVLNECNIYDVSSVHSSDRDLSSSSLENEEIRAAWSRIAERRKKRPFRGDEPGPTFSLTRENSRPVYCLLFFTVQFISFHFSLYPDQFSIAFIFICALENN